MSFAVIFVDDMGVSSCLGLLNIFTIHYRSLEGLDDFEVLRGGDGNLIYVTHVVYNNIY